jgi:hypothetical protein
MKITDIHPIAKFLKPREQYNENSQKDMDTATILFILFAIIAAYLSWSCNTIQKESGIIKIIYALFAAIFNWFYILLYFIFRHPCTECK